MFTLMFLSGLISFVTAAFYLFLCCGMEKYKGDRSSLHRKKAWKNIWLHFGVNMGSLYGSASTAMDSSQLKQSP